MKTYDCFLFFDEFDILELRLETLNNYVDTFVLVESPLTHTGISKPLHFLENQDRFKKWLHKIRHVTVQPNPENNDSWKRENHDRITISNGLFDALPDDIIFISDCDEIWRPELRDTAIEASGSTRFIQNMYYYFLNCKRTDKSWEKGTVRLKHRDFFNAQFHRKSLETQKILNAGWHFSYMGGIEKIVKKVESFAHTEFNSPYFLDKKRMSNLIEQGKDIFDRGISYKLCSIDVTYPKPILENRDKWKNFIKNEPLL